MRATLCSSIVLLAAGALLARAAPKTAPTAGSGETEPAKAIATMLPERPAGFGRPISDRAAWDALAKVPAYRGVVPQAEALLKKPLPESPDELYLDFSKTGNRTRWQRVASNRRGRIARLALAECLQARGRFVAALAKTIAAVCAERTWVMPAHDRGLANFKATRIDIDLGSSHLAWDLATADWLLGDRLGAETRKRIRDNVGRRILGPYLEMVAGRRKKNWWMTCTNNWNAVCLANVTGSALALVESRDERAVFVAAARDHSRSFLRGFTADGYCSEGVGYWNYGFGYYVLLAEAIHQATGGRVDLMARKEARKPATYAWRIEIAGGVYPAFADCSVGSRPSGQLVHFIRRRLGLGTDRDDKEMISPGGSLAGAMMYSFPNSATRSARGGEAPEAPGLRTWFEHAGILISRPAKGSACRMAVALKGGHNGEHHNHNNVGSYVVVVGKRPVLLDPGAEVYTARTFSARRYESKVLNSYGHPVPRVAGQLQKTGSRARARVVRTQFTEAGDALVMDLRGAYGVKQLKTLQRTFIYSRQGAGSLTVTDEAAFTEPAEFETALITLGKWRKLADNSLLISDAGEAVRVDIDAGGAAFEIRPEEIREHVRTRTLPTRLSLRLTAPVTQAKVALKITPATPKR